MKVFLSVSHLIDKLPHIKKLHISNCEIDDSFYSLLRLCENIVELKIDLPPNEVRKIERNSIVFVDSLCTMANLRILEVSGIWNIKSILWNYLKIIFPNLK